MNEDYKTINYNSNKGVLKYYNPSDWVVSIDTSSVSDKATSSLGTISYSDFSAKIKAVDSIYWEPTLDYTKETKVEQNVTDTFVDTMENGNINIGIPQSKEYSVTSVRKYRRQIINLN